MRRAPYLQWKTDGTDGQTDGLTDGRQTDTLRLPLDAANVIIIAVTELILCFRITLMFNSTQLYFII